MSNSSQQYKHSLYATDYDIIHDDGAIIRLYSDPSQATTTYLNQS